MDEYGMIPLIWNSRKLQHYWKEDDKAPSTSALEILLNRPHPPVDKH